MMELVAQRTENSKTYDLGGRKRALECFTGAIHYRDDFSDLNETWKPIDLTFENGKITKASYILEVGGLGITVTSKRTGTVLSIALARIGLAVTERLVAWEFVGNQAIWRNAALNTDVVIEAYSGGIRFKRVLKSKSAPLEAEFIYSKMVGSADNVSFQVSARDADGEPLAVQFTDVAGKLVEALDSKIDLDELKFPIEIDPVVTLQPSDKDTTLLEAIPGTPHGSLDFVNIVTSNAGARMRIVEGFDLSGGIPGGAVIVSATSYLYYYLKGGDDPVGRTHWCYRLTQPTWVELQATWNSYKSGSPWTNPGGDWTTDDPVGASTTVPAGFGWMSWNVKTLVEDAIANRSNLLDLLIKDSDDSVLIQYNSRCYSKEYTGDTSLCPKLVITYTLTGPLPLHFRTP